MSHHDGWSTLMEANGRFEAEILKEALEIDGFSVVLIQEAVGQLYVLPSMPLSRVEICVPDAQFENAQAWLEAYNKGELRNDNAELGDSDHE